MAKNIDARLKNIQGIFSNSHDSILGNNGTFIIPDYQRAYNWKFNEQCDKLWQDIEYFIETNQNDTYFFGSIIINNDKEKLYIIDGQQRITTFILLLKALLIRINDLLYSFPEDEDGIGTKKALESRRERIIDCLYHIDDDEIYLVVAGNSPLSTLPVKYDNHSINEEYQNEIKTILHGQTFEDIQNTVSINKRKRKDNRYTNFFRNLKFFLENLEKYDSAHINRFAKSLLEKCQLIVVISYQTEEAIEIFNSLNSTGCP